jgi:hypothetical protein
MMIRLKLRASSHFRRLPLPLHELSIRQNGAQVLALKKKSPATGADSATNLIETAVTVALFMSILWWDQRPPKGSGRISRWMDDQSEGGICFRSPEMNDFLPDRKE